MTSRKARAKYGLDLPARGGPFDALRPQRLAAPVTVYIEQFSAHPLERDAAEWYARPDGYIGQDGTFSTAQRASGDVPVYEVELHPRDGLYLLPFMGRRADGGPWDDDGPRQPFYPDAARLFEEIDRFEIGADGEVNALSSHADFDFYRPAPSGGYTKGLPAHERTDAGEGDIPPERLGLDYFPYRPGTRRREPLAATLARVTNMVQQAMDSGRYAGGLWLEGSPFVEETSYWLNLLIDTTAPLVASAGSIGSTGAANIIDAVTYLNSGIWADERNRDRLGVVCVEDEQIFTAREVQKADDRPGGFVATGGHGGVVGSLGKPGPPVLTFVPVRRHTHCSEVRLSLLPRRVAGARVAPGGAVAATEVAVTNEDGELLEQAVPAVRILKHARYLQRTVDADDTVEVEVVTRLRRDLDTVPLAGIVVEAGTPYGDVTAPLEDGLRHAAFSGAPFVKVGRGDVGGFVPVDRVPLGVAGGNLTATKARILLMACLLRFGAPPPAEDPRNPTAAEEQAVREAFAQYQQIFDTH